MKRILSTFLLRTLALACGLFVAVIDVSSAVYYETIEANKDFYICNVANGKYLKNNSGALSLVTNVEDASTWQFSGTSGSVSLTDGTYFLQINTAVGTGYKEYQIDPGASSTGEITLPTTSTKFTLGGDVNGYTFFVSKKYLEKWYSVIPNVERTFYFSSSNLTRSTQTNNNNAKWKLVSKRQIDNTISLDPTSITVDAIQGGEAAEAQFNINHNGAPTSITITNGTTSLTINSPKQPAQIKVAFTVADDGSKTIVISDVDDPSNFATYSFGISDAASLTLTVSTTAASGVAIDDDKKTIQIKGNVVQLKQQTIAWTQDFTSLTPTSAPIALNAIAIDKNGVPTGRPITYTLASDGVVKIVDGKLYVFAEGITSIKASVASDTTYVGTEKTLTIKVSGVATHEITKTNAATTDLFTGTVGGPSASYIFHKGITPIDLSRCFTEGGIALFDTLYVFGITSNTDGELITYMGTDEVEYASVPLINTPSSSVGCNATTPCYVYAKINETTYSYARTFDATRTRYNWENEQNGKHIYFTGYCPFAYMGVTSSEDGWMYFKGGEAATVNIYLDNCQISGRFKTQSGGNYNYEAYTLLLTATQLGQDKPNANFISGVSSPFVFTSSSTDGNAPYTPHIHISGNNHLKGQLGSFIRNTWGKVNLEGIVTEMSAGVNDVFTYSAPITIKPTKLNQYTHLVLDDIWKDNTITNGYLRLDSEKGSNPSEKVVAIDLGSANGSLTINGGQYHLRNSAADGTYACNLAVGYRRYSKMVEKLGQTVLIHLYGFGGDMPDSKLVINSGTFTIYKNMYPNGVDALGDTIFLGVDYYRDDEKFLDLRLPAGNKKSQINGGTFNGITNVCFCNEATSTGASPINAVGNWLCLRDVEDITTTHPNGSVEFEIEEEYGEDHYDPLITYDLRGSGISNVTGGTSYGGQSVNAYKKGEKTIVSLLLPAQITGDEVCPGCEYQKETYIRQWAVAIPVFDATKVINDAPQEVNIGGPIEVQVAETEDIRYQTNQLLFLDGAGLEMYSYNLAEQGASLTIQEGVIPRGQITNEKGYEIKKNLNILKTVQADTWYTFTAPYDVHQISVIEVNENLVSAEATRSEAIELQAQNNLKVFYNLENFIVPNENGRASSLTLPALLPGAGGSINKLTHYDGTNVMKANYYLYELKSEEFTTDGIRDELDIVWEPVATPAEGSPILTKGKVYAMQFPWCPMCNDLASRTYYDYWSNKMILFYGKGPQTIAGTNLHNTIVSDAMPNLGATATLAGNSTLADMTLAAETGYVHNTTTDYFEQKNASYTLKPTEGFLLYNPGAKSMPARISRTGQMEYDENVETGVGGVPTVGDRTSLMLYGAYDGFELLSLCEQLVTVYNLQGNIIFQQYMAEGEQVYVATGAGVFIVRGESETIKVMVE